MAKKKKKKKNNRGKKNLKKRLKIRYGRIFLTTLVLGLILYLFFTIFKFKITNIYIIGNEYLTDQEIIEYAGIQNYPSTFSKLCIPLKNKLKKNILIKDATVYKRGLFEIVIDIKENKPMFFNKTNNNTVLEDTTLTDLKFNVPLLINYVPDKIYKRFLTKMLLVNRDTLKRISEIEYKPNEVDKNRFLLSMSDGNYVYLTLDKFENINNYVEIKRKFEGKKGILYLDSGEYFKVLE